MWLATAVLKSGRKGVLKRDRDKPAMEAQSDGYDYKLPLGAIRAEEAGRTASPEPAGGAVRSAAWL